MKVAVVYNPGGAERFILEERPMPEIKEGHILVKVKAFGLNRSELMTRKGLSPSVQFPRVLGIECVGVVVSDPTGEWLPGQKIAAWMGEMGRQYDGSYAEYTLLPKAILHPFESTLTWEQLGAIPEMFQTVFGSLHLALKIRSGCTLLIRGGTSSIGMLSIQLAKLAGLTVLATTRKPEKQGLLTSNGADHVLIDDGQLETKVKALYSEGVDYVLELVGTGTLPDSLRCAAPGGTVCMTGMLAEQWAIPNFAPMDYIPATVSLTVYDSGDIRIKKEDLQDFIHEVEKGQIKLNISATFSLEEIADAHRFMESNAAAGKIVVLTNV